MATLLSNGSTIPITHEAEFVRVTAASSVTGIILESGTQHMQRLYVINEGDFSITFADPAISNVADKRTIDRLTACFFMWSTYTEAWFAEPFWIWGFPGRTK